MMALLPALATLRAVSAMPASSMSATTMRAPSPAKARQRARPMPLAPPVTTAVLSLRLSMGSPGCVDAPSLTPRIGDVKRQGIRDDGILWGHGLPLADHRGPATLRSSPRAQSGSRHLRRYLQHHHRGARAGDRDPAQRRRA